MSFKGSKGWKLQNDGVMIDENHNVVADFMTTSEKDLANAKLAEKSLEMLEILIDLRNCKETWSDLFQSDKDRIEMLIKEVTEL